MQEVNEIANNDYKYRRNQFPMQTKRSETMSFTRCNTGISRHDENLVTSTAAREIHRNTLTKKISLDCISSIWKSKKTRIFDDQDLEVVVHDLQNSRPDPKLKTIENCLNRFGKPTILPRLEKSLEEVKRNQIDREDHERLSKLVDKELQKFSLTVHPDRAGDNEWQSALNAIREVLKTLTVVFLDNIFIDYKYEYFSRLDISLLINEKERNNTIQALFYKISVLSETKRMNIVGEIRKFLTESEKCVKSYFEGHKSDFKKYRDYALYHLGKNIEGYKKLVKESSILIEECSKENDSIRAVVQKVVHQSSREGSILRQLEQVARNSFQGNFKIFPIDKAMDEYYILPFVDYINVLSMCNLLMKHKTSRFSSPFSEVDFRTDDDRDLFNKAYILAYDIYYNTNETMKVRETMFIYEYAKELSKTLGEIFEVLQKDYRVNAYKEGKSNREEMYEKLLALKNILKDLEEKEKKFAARVSQYEMEWEDSSIKVVKYIQDNEESYKEGMTMPEKESEKYSNKLSSSLEGTDSQLKMEWNESSESVANYVQDKQKSFKVDMTKRGKESEEGTSKFSAPLEGQENQYKIELEASSESVINCRQDKEESFKIGLRKREKESEEDSSKFNTPLEGEANQCNLKSKVYSESVVNYRQDKEESFKAGLTRREIESEEDYSKFIAPFGGEENQCKMKSKVSSESVVNCRQYKEESFKARLRKREKESEEDSSEFSSLSERGENEYKMESKESSESAVNYRRDEEEIFKAGMIKREKETKNNSYKFNSLSEEEKIVEELRECKEELSKNPSNDKWLIVEGSDVVEEVGIDCISQENW